MQSTCHLVILERRRYRSLICVFFISEAGGRVSVCMCGYTHTHTHTAHKRGRREEDV